MSLSECKTMGGNEHENVWTFIENIAAIALLLALLSMLLPFCKFSAGGQEMTLSGLDVVKAGGRAGYTYLTEGRVADTFVLKAPITVGTVKSSLSYVQGVGQMRLLAVCAIAALLPVLLCFLSVGMLFLAEGKRRCCCQRCLPVWCWQNC